MKSRSSGYSGSGVSAEMEQSLGALTVEYTSLEMQLRSLIWDLINSDSQEVGKVITANLSMWSLLDLASSLYRLRTRDDKLLERMKSSIGKINELRARRNSIMHSLWVQRPDSETALSIKMQARKKAGYRETYEEFSAADVLSVASQLHDAGWAVGDIHYAIISSSPALKQP